MSDLNPDSRMQRRGVGDLLHPACCAVCGNGTCEAGYIDIGVYYDYEGQVYLCMNCVNEIADTAGLLTDTELHHLKGEITKVAHANEVMTQELKVAHEKLAHYDALFGDRFNSHPDVMADLETNSGPDENPNGTDNDSNESESVVDEPVVSDGHSDVSRSEQSNGIEL